MAVVTSVIVGYLLLSLLATVILVSACIVGGRFDRMVERSRSPQPEASDFAAEVEVAILVSAEKTEKSEYTDMNRLIPQMVSAISE